MMASYFTALSARVFAMGSGVICGVIALRLYRHLSPEAYGVVVVALTLVGYLPLLDGGFRTTVNRAMLAEADAEARRGLLRFGQIFYSWLGLVVLGVALLLMLGYAFTPPGRASGQPLLFFVALAAAGGFAVISSIQAGVLVGLQAQASFFLLTAVSSWFSLMSLWLVLRHGGGLWAFPVSICSGVLAVYPTALWLIRRRERQVEFLIFKTDAAFWSAFQRLRGDAWHCFRSQISIVVLYTIDIILVGMLFSPAEAAVYAVLTRIFAIVRGFMQSLSEITWPIIAQRGWGDQQLNRVLNRVNAWAVGSVTGALGLTLAPFPGWYIHPDWVAPEPWVWLMAGRFLITSLAAPAAYLLYGSGDFRSISRCLERELIGGVVLALVLGPAFGVAGVAAAFLMSTALGTFYPIYRAYARRTGEPVRATLGEIWPRAATGLTISMLSTKVALGYWTSGSQLVIAGAVGVAGGLAACLAWSAVRMMREEARLTPRTALRFMNSI